MSEPTGTRGGPQVIPRPKVWAPGGPAPWARSVGGAPERIVVDDVRASLARRGPPGPVVGEVPRAELPGPARRPAAVLCALFDADGQANVVLTRRSSRLRSHTHQVSFPGGRIDPGETALHAALREAREEVGLDASVVEVIGELSSLRTAVNPAPITPFVAVIPPGQPMQANPSEVERVFAAPLVELTEPGVYREEIWTFPGGIIRPIHFFELVGDTVWGATARMLCELLDLVVLGSAVS